MVQKEHLVAKFINFKKMKIVAFIYFGLCLIIASANGQSDMVNKAEQNFRKDFMKTLSDKLNNIPLGDKPFSKLIYYSYKIINEDSIKWSGFNYQNKLIDSIVYLAFNSVIDSFNKIGNIELLKNNSMTFIPVIILYKVYAANGMFTDKVSIGHMVDAFSWERSEFLDPEAVNRVYSPTIFRLPKSKKYVAFD